MSSWKGVPEARGRAAEGSKPNGGQTGSEVNRKRVQVGMLIRRQSVRYR